MKQKLSIILLITLSICLYHQGYAQVNKLLNDRNIDIREVSVSGARSPLIYSKVSRAINVITKEEIKSAPAQSVQELLDYIVGVDIRQRGNFGTQADLSIRGGSFDQVLVLLNGVSISDPQTGHFNLDVPVDIESIERIEILRGPGSRVFGTNAFSGAINIITTNGEQNKLSSSVMFGQHGLYKANISTSRKFGNYNNQFSISRGGSDGYIDNTDFKNLNLFYQGKLNVKKSEFDFQAGHTNKEFGANSYYTPEYPNQFEATKTSFGSIKFTTGDNVRISPLIYWRRHQDRFELFRDNPASWYKGHNYHLTNVAGANLNVVVSTKIGKTSVGIDFRNENIKSNILGEDLDEAIKVPGEADGIFYKGYNRRNLSFYLEHYLLIKKWAFSGGFMTNRNSDLGDDVSLFPGIDISYELVSDLKLYSTANKSLRLPTFTDLYYSGPTNIGNPNLKPEEATSIEAGLRFNKLFLDANISVFKRYGTNMIDWVKENEEDKWQCQNLTSINASGIEMNAKLLPGAYYKKDLLINSVSFSYSYTEMNKTSTNLISKYVLDYLRHKISIGLNHDLLFKIGVDWKITYQNRAGGYINYSDGIYGEEVPYKSFWLCDMKIFYPLKKINIYCEVSNLLNVKYQDIGNLIQPGRWLRFGLKFEI
ncbi:TonB-dependent receptor plug domain-containing protein [Bacteroidota bacterium]